ncbi:MAG: Ig domain-containing protein, partial [Clostridia bacterium]|nr:Ig domain-containing protein [Clostridia bacterium]
VATVSADGIVTPVAEGSAKITVTTHNKKKATITINVVDPFLPTAIAFTAKTQTLNIDSTLDLNALVKLTPETATRRLTWTSSKAKVATVSADGIVTPVAEGSAKITVTTHNKKKATITVKVVNPYKALGVSLTPSTTQTLYIEQTLQLTAKLNPETARTALTWTSSKPSVATVDSNGLVTGVKKGSATIIVATDNGKKAKLTVKVLGETSLPHSDELNNLFGNDVRKTQAHFGASNEGNFWSVGDNGEVNLYTNATSEIIFIDIFKAPDYTLFNVSTNQGKDDSLFPNVDAALTAGGWTLSDQKSDENGFARIYSHRGTQYKTIVFFVGEAESDTARAYQVVGGLNSVVELLWSET